MFLVCGPRSEFEFDERREQERAQDVKLRLLEALENKWKFSQDTQQDMSYYPSYSTFLSLSTSLFANFTENLQFHVRDVHLRYEDDVTQSDANIVTGLLIENLSIQSADETWEPTFVVAGSSPVTRKLVQLQNFSLYFDSNVPLVKDKERQEMIDEMRDGMRPDAAHVFVLDPVNGKAFVSRDQSEQPLRSRANPRIKIDFQLEQIALSLNIVQYQLFLSMVDEISRRQLLLKNCRFRPKVPIRENPKAWWTYAVNVFMHPRREELKRGNWSYVLRRCTQITKYCDVYLALVAQPEEASREMKAIKDQVESELTFEEIKCLRELVYARYKKLCLPVAKAGQETQGWSYLQSWLPSWFSGENSTTNNATGVEESAENMSFTSNFEDDLMDVLNTAADECQFTQDAVFTQITFSVNQASAVLVADPLYLKSTPVRKPHTKKMQQIMQFVITKPFLTIETRPRTGTHKFHAKFSELTLEDKVSSAPNFAYLIHPQGNNSSSSHFPVTREPLPNPESALFELILEKKWGKNILVNKLFVKTDPLQIVYSKSVFDVLYRFFSSKSFLSRERSSYLTNATRMQYEQLKSQTKAGIQNAVEDLFIEKMDMNPMQSVKWEFDLNISAPQIIIPQDISLPESSLVIFDLGRLVFRNRSLDHLRPQNDDADVYLTPPSSPPPEPMDGPDFSSSTLKTLYQRFCLEINDMQLIVGSVSDNWNHALQRGSGPLHVLNRFSLTFELQRRISSFSADLPAVILTGSLPHLFVFLDENKIRSLKNVSDLLLKSKVVPEQREVDPMAKPQPSLVERQNRIFFLTELNVHRFSVALQCRKENLAEVQVFEVQCKLEKSKKCYSISFSVSSLMMIDAHQKLGKEFEILLASHRDLLIDPRNGVIADAQNRVRSYSTISDGVPPASRETEALISFKLTSTEDGDIVDVVFNHFDAIANQETLVELVAFFRGIFPPEQKVNNDPEFNAKKSRTGFSRQTEIRIDFRQLNILLLRSIECLKTGQEKKVATASFSGAKFCIKLGHDAIVDGSLQRMKIMDLCSKDAPGDRTIMKIGSDQENLGPGQSSVKAVEFVMKRTFAENLLDLNISLVSLYYFHSPRFLLQLTSCAKEFKAYMSALATTITTAATEVAKELVLSPSMKSSHVKERRNRKISSALVKELRIQMKAENPLIVLPTSSTFIEGIKRSIWGEVRDPRKTQRSSFFEGLAVGLDVQNGSVRLVDDVDEDRALVEVLYREVYLFHNSKDSIHKGNIRTVVSSDYFNQEKSGWEPLIELWAFTLAWDLKTERQGKDGIIHRHVGPSQKGKLTMISNEIINFNVTNVSLELYHYMKNKWDSVDIEPQGSAGIHALTSSPISWLVNPKQKTEVIPASEWTFVMELQCIGISLVNHLNEELLYVTLSQVLLEYLKTDAKHAMNCSVREMQVDNQLRDHCKEVAIHQLIVENSDPMSGQPAITLSFQKSIVPHVHYFTDIQFKCRDVVLNLEELLLLKLYEFFGYPSSHHQNLDRAVGHAINQTVSSIASKASFVYVVLLEVVLRHVDLSVYTSGHLPAELMRLKEKVGLSLISFENAKVQLQSFTKENSLEDLSSLWKSIADHYKKQLQRQAAKILGSVDFLGNPLGFVNDVTEGLTDLAGGNVGGLVTSLTHGISNSTAKFTSSLSKSLEVTTVDVRHQEMRRRIHQDGRDHLRAGIRGLGVGIMGGVTSIVTQTYDGVANHGFEGLFSGFGKGLLGTVTKPTVGVLDFATGAASAVRESIRKISHPVNFTRKRPPRVCVGPRGLLPPFDEDQAHGQQYFYTSSNIRDREDSELFDSFHAISSECVCFISNERLRFLTWNPASKKHGKVILSLTFEDVVKCATEKRSVGSDLTIAYIVIVAYEDDFTSDDFNSTDFPSFGPSDGLSRRTRRRVRTTNTLQCSSDRVALRVCQVINLAKSEFDKNRKSSLTADRRM